MKKIQPEKTEDCLQVFDSRAIEKKNKRRRGKNILIGKVSSKIFPSVICPSETPQHPCALTVFESITREKSREKNKLGKILNQLEKSSFQKIETIFISFHMKTRMKSYRDNKNTSSNVNFCRFCFFLYLRCCL